MKAMVLAAGVGSRLDPLTTQVPKPLVPIANRPVLEHIYCLLRQHGITDVVSNLHHLPEKLTAYFGCGSNLGMNLSFHYEATLSGDAGGVRACRKFLADDTFIVLMGDLFTDADLTAIVKEHKAKGALATIGLTRVDDVTQFGVALTDARGFITGFQEKPAIEEALSNLASTGIYIFEPEVFKHIPETGSVGFGRQIFPALVQAGHPVLGCEIGSYWSDVGTIKQYKQSNFDAIEGKIQVELPGIKTETGWLGHNSFIDDSCVVDGLLMLGKNSRLGKGVKIKGRVIIGDNCLVEQQAELEDSVVWSDTSIESRAILKNAVIGFNCVINGSTHVREMAVVSPDPDSTKTGIKAV